MTTFAYADATMNNMILLAVGFFSKIGDLAENYLVVLVDAYTRYTLVLRAV